MKRRLVLLLSFLMLGCASVPQDREWMCRTDMECEMEEDDGMDWQVYLAELDDLEYFDLTGKIR